MKEEEKPGSSQESQLTGVNRWLLILPDDAFALHFVVDLRLALSAKEQRRPSRWEYRSGSRRMGGWFWLEGGLRHFCQGWLQRQHRPEATGHGRTTPLAFPQAKL